MSEVPEERCLEWSPMFQSKVREVIIQTVHDDVHEVHVFLQLRNPILPLPLHSIQQKGNARSGCNRTVRVFVSGLLPKPKRSLMGGQKLDSDLVVPSDVCRGVVKHRVQLSFLHGSWTIHRDNAPWVMGHATLYNALYNP